MKVKLGNTSVFWALSDPGSNKYIGYGETSVGGYSKVDVQETQITLTEDQPVSDEFDYEALPNWAKRQILSSKSSGTIEVLTPPVIAKRVETKPDESGKISKEEETSKPSVLDKSVSAIKKLTKDLPADVLKNLLEAEKLDKNRIGVTSFLEEKINTSE